ncbi:MAG: glycosyltransferase [Chitinophagaceae bacterium]|nr:glycosyltransferase [Chitinophagaceae bacterium]
MPMPFPVECFILHPFMTLSVIIVSYNVKYFLEQCLHSVMAATGRIKTEVIVVDNHSSDGSLPYLRPLFPPVHFVDAGSNLGFGRANNLGLSKATGDYILFLNPDTLVPEDCFEKCLRFMENSLQAGALGVRMIDGNGRFLPESKRSFPRASTAFFKLSGLATLFPKSRVFNKYSLGYLDEFSEHKVDVLAGAFLFIRKQVLDTVGGFDERFFMYGEDIDLSYRVKQAGYDNWYLSNTSIIHFKGESTRKDHDRYVKMFYEAMSIFVQKHYKRRSWIFRGLLKTGIFTRETVSSLSYIFSAHQQPEATVKKTIIVGTAKEYKECIALYNSHDTSERIPGRVKVHEDDTEDAIGSLYQLSELVTTFNVKAIIFCQGFLQYSNIIDIIQRLNQKLAYRFHAAGSNSIVGSDSKITTGQAIGSE